MHPDIEKIIEELYAVDPALKERGGDLRALVASLLEAKPVVDIDQNFILNLRKSVLNRARAQTSLTPPVHSSHSLAWLAFRLTPIGAVLLLFFILYPGKNALTPNEALQENIAPLNTPHGTVREYQTPTQSGGQGSYKTSAPMQNSPTLDSAPGSSAPNMILKSALQNTVTLDAVTLPQPGFVVIRVSATNKNYGEVLGVSALLPAGTTSGVSITLSHPPAPGETIATLLYIDNGDGRYTNDDTYSTVLP